MFLARSRCRSLTNAGVFLALAAFLLGACCRATVAQQAPGAQPSVSSASPPAVDAGLALTPPMGWNSWNRFACNINEQLIRETADALVATGMRDAGYRYVIIDDCWHGERDAHGDIEADAKRFPGGIKALADYVHARGLKFGIYSDAGTRTCGDRPGSRGYEFQDAAQYAKWGVDYLKYDWCHTSTQNAQASYSLMREALNHSGRPITFSMCEWGTASPWLWANGIGNLWRTTGDIDDKWEGKFDYKLGIMNIVDKNEPLYSYAGPGHWNDPDMLEVGNGNLSDDEYRAHFSLWAMMSAPLIAGNDIAHMSPRISAILMNRDVIAIDQDQLGRQGRRVRKTGDLEVWSKQLADGGRAVLLLNRGSVAADIHVSWSDLGYFDTQAFKLHDLWTGADLGSMPAGYTAHAIPSHGVVMLRLRAADLTASR